MPRLTAAEHGPADRGIRLRRSDPAGPGIRRRRCGRGFRYTDAAGRPVRDRDTLARIKALVIPPAWEDVWICAEPGGHIQAVGTDAAGRRQYRYHDLWRERRDRDKHDRVLEFGSVLPRLREQVGGHLAGRGLRRERVLAAAVRLIDLGFFRPGGEEYAAENGTFGIATVRREHVTCRRGELVFDYLAKGAKHREQAVADADVQRVVVGLKRRNGGGDGLFAYRSGPGWHDVTAAEINGYLAELTGGEYTAKDFRTWHATVLAPVGLAVSEHAAGTAAAHKRDVITETESAGLGDSMEQARKTAPTRPHPHTPASPGVQKTAGPGAAAADRARDAATGRGRD